MPIVKVLFDSISPLLRKRIYEFVRSLKTDPVKPSKPMDLVFVNILFKLLAIKD
jgi:hypothetical protein